MNKVKVSFLPNLWIKCLHNNEICLGRTYLQKSGFKGVENLQLVCLISENGNTRHVPFLEIDNAVILKIFTAFDFETENSIRNATKGQINQPFDLVHILAKHQLKTKMS